MALVYFAISIQTINWQNLFFMDARFRGMKAKILLSFVYFKYF